MTIKNSTFKYTLGAITIGTLCCYGYSAVTLDMRGIIVGLFGLAIGVIALWMGSF